MSNVQKTYVDNDKLRKKKSWEADAIAEITASKLSTVRIHASGDFDTAEYVEAWMRIVKACPGTKFYAYTRSWTVPAMLKSLVELAQLPNMDLWFSADKSMPKPPVFDFTRIAYLALDDADEPRYNADLVFRHNSTGAANYKTVKKRMGRFRSLVCPHEQGVTYKTEMTCDKCKICFNNKDKPALVQIG